MVTDFYSALFTSSAGTRFEEVLQHVPSRVTVAMNDELTRDYTEEEIKSALDSMGDLKAPGPDGMPALFYKKFWKIVGKDVVKEVTEVLNGGPMPESWNDTIVVLIPKVQNPERMEDLRPLSLCNVVYKTSSKVLANRLKLVLPDVISLNQSAFFPGETYHG